MDRTRFMAILEAYGAEPARWPEAERAAAQAFAAAHPELDAALGAAAKLDALLALDTRTAADEGALRARVLATLPKGDSGVLPFPAARGARWRMAAALAACMVAGLAIGFTGQREDSAAAADAALGAAFAIDADFGSEG